MARTTRDLCQTCWQDVHPDEYAPAFTRDDAACSRCGDEFSPVTRSRIENETAAPITAWSTPATLPRYYSVQATVAGRQVPTFYLDANVQGITSVAGAERVAFDIVGTDAHLSVTVAEDVTR